MDGMTFVAGFIMGGFTTFIVTAVTIWKPRLDELTARWKTERERRIVAEDNASHTQFDPDWGPPPIPVPRTQDAPVEMGTDWMKRGELIDLTGIDDVPYDE